MVGVTAVVVVPAHDEEARIAECVRALSRQTIGIDAFEIVLVLDRCTDRTEEIAVSVAAEHGLKMVLLAGPGEGTGPARRLGMETACRRLHELGRPLGLIASTDADTRPAPDWLARQLSHRDRGAAVIAGRIDLDPAESRSLPAAVRARREHDAATRLELVHRHDPQAAHHHFAGASLSITAFAYRSVGGLEPRRALEDEAFALRLAEHKIPIHRPADVSVTTSARLDGRAERGLSMDLTVAHWMDTRRYRAAEFPLSRLVDAKPTDLRISVIIPVKMCAGTIGAVLDQAVAPAVEAGLVDEVVVVDAASSDPTVEVARRHGARVVQQDALRSDLGPALGKGDAMWRALQVTDGDIVCFLDGDTADPRPAHLLGLLGPLLLDDGVSFVKGTFERPFDLGDRSIAKEGGRVTELMARPLLNMHFPQLAGFGQPLAGEFAARRTLLETLSFPVGYGVETATLIDALGACGLQALAETDLGTRQNRHQSLRALGEMAYAVLAAVERRLPGGSRTAVSNRYIKPWDDDAVASVALHERPPLLGHRRARGRSAIRRGDVGVRRSSGAAPY